MMHNRAGTGFSGEHRRVNRIGTRARTSPETPVGRAHSVSGNWNRSAIVEVSAHTFPGV